MSLQFSDPTLKKGIIQEIESELGFADGAITGNTTLFQKITASVNLAVDDFTALAIRASGTWDFDDSNQTDYPIIKTNLVSGQGDYAFTTDGSSNLILEIKKVAILPSATSTIYREVNPIDVPSNSLNNNILSEVNASGVPYFYDKIANALMLDPVPNYNATNGLKIYISREATYFTTSDTTKKPGVPGLFHRYFVVKAAHKYAASKGMPIAGGRLRNGSFTGLLMEINDMETRIEKYFGLREKDVRKIMKPKRPLFI